jgi:hypothetical protein
MLFCCILMAFISYLQAWICRLQALEFPWPANRPAALFRLNNVSSFPDHSTYTILFIHFGWRTNCDTGWPSFNSVSLGSYLNELLVRHNKCQALLACPFDVLRSKWVRFLWFCTVSVSTRCVTLEVDAILWCEKFQWEHRLPKSQSWFTIFDIES